MRERRTNRSNDFQALVSCCLGWAVTVLLASCSPLWAFARPSTELSLAFMRNSILRNSVLKASILKNVCLCVLFASLLQAQTTKAGKPAQTPAVASQSPIHFTDVTASTGITFQHASAAENKYIVMAGGVLLLDYDRDGWLDIYFTNAPTVDMALRGEKARSALYHNNHDGTFTDVTEKAGVGYPCWAMGGAVGDYNNDGWLDIYVTCLGGNVLYRNNGDGAFTDVTEQAGVGDGRWSTGAAFADYDGDGFVDLFVSNYVDRRLEDLQKLANAPLCPFLNLQVECDGPLRGLFGLNTRGRVMAMPAWMIPMGITAWAWFGATSTTMDVLTSMWPTMLHPTFFIAMTARVTSQRWGSSQGRR